jgi:two-component system sensor histidine kinase/response regulator
MSKHRTMEASPTNLTRDESGGAPQGFVVQAQRLALACAAIALAYVPVMITAGFGWSAGVLAIAALAQGLLVPLVRMGQLELARALPVLVQAVLVAWLSCQHGADSLIPMYCMVLLFFPPLLFGFEERRWLFALEGLVGVAMMVSLVGGELAATGHRLAVVMPQFPTHVPAVVFAASGYMLALIISDLRLRQDRLRREVRVRRLAEQEAQRARMEAEEASRAKAEFVATVSHEIRTPLTGVLGMTDLLAHTALSSRQRDMIRVIRTSGEHLRLIIEDILDFSKIEARELELTDAPFYLGALVEETVELLAMAAAERGQVLVMDLDLPGDLELRGDAARLRQVLTNLITNASKFTPAGWVEVRVHAPVSQGIARVRVEVEDTGVGIAPERRGRIFEPFAQVSGAREVGGTGLGLSISQRLMQTMGGSLDFTSTLHEGSTFFAEVGLPVTGNSLPEHDLEGLRVGVFTPSPRRAMALRNALLRMQARVASVSDLTELAGRPWDVVIVDTAAVSPNVDRRDLCELLRVPERRLLLLHPRIARAEEASLHYPCARSTLFSAIRGCLVAEVAPLDDATEDARFEGVHALVAEDNPVNQMVIRGFLNHFGVTCDVVADGREACERFDAVRHQLVFMDVQMPLVTGLDATRWIRSHVDQDATIPIIATTAYSLQDSGEDGLTRGFDDHLTKPLRKAALLGVLRRHVPHAECLPDVVN